MDGICSRGKWKKYTLGTLLLLCMFITTLGGPTSQPCKDGEYPNENGTCCDKCSPGHKLGAECVGKGLRSTCLECPSNQYMDTVNFFRNCFRCTRCKEREDEISPCKRIQNTVCRCKDGFYKEAVDLLTSQCLKCKSCEAGERQTNKCTPENNTVCECERDHYKIRNKCLPCQNCTTDCELHCPLVQKNGKTPEVRNEFLNIVLIGVGVLAVSLLAVVLITHKTTKWYTKQKLTGSSPQPEASPDSTEVLIHSEEPSYNHCNTAVPQNPVCEQDSSNLPDCIPLEIKIPELIYTVLDLVPVSRVKQLARSLGVTDIEIEHVETDHRTCKEAHYQMLRVWAERGSRAGGGGGGGGGRAGQRGGVLHRPLLQEMLDNLSKMDLIGAVEELETKYCVQ
ncbi:tumor necrosis factor receptor superfamily member 1A [Polymixia lowei]